MNELAVKFQLLNFFAHMAHNVSYGATFPQDHAFFADIYDKADDHYDSTVERMIGLGFNPNIQQIVAEASNRFKPMKAADNDEMFQQIVSQINAINIGLGAICKAGDITEGTRQMFGSMADEWEVVKYKLKQRLK